MTNTLKAIGLLAITLVTISFLIFFGMRDVSASAPSGLPAIVATTSPAIVNTTASTIFATSTCSARVITTVGSTLMLTFTDTNGAVPTATFGILQASSTTAVYDSGQYGCNAMKAYSPVQQTLTVLESR